jgi:calcium channel MID1
MLPRKLSLLQSRLLTNLLTTCLLVAVWPSSHAQCLTYAAELPTALDRDQQLAPVPKVLAYVHDDRVDDEGNAGYAPGFDYFDRSIVGRQEPQLQELVDGEKKVVNIDPGQTVHFVLKRGRSRVRRGDDDAIHVLDAYDPHNASGTLANGELAVEQEEGVGDDNAPNEVKKRQAGNSIWISANTCKQPVASRKDVSKPHQQLVMYVSASAKNQQPGPGTETSPVLFEKGFANVSLQVNSDVYVGISAPILDPEWFGSWNFELAASSNGSYHSYNDTNPFLFMVDTDSESALFITYNLSDAQSNKSDAVAKWNQSNPMRMYAFPAGDNATIAGLEHSFCAVRDLFANSGMRSNTSITTKFGGDLPKSQFHISGLASNQTYNGFLIVEGNDKQALELPGVGTVRGGGKVFQQFNWTTKKGMPRSSTAMIHFADNTSRRLLPSPLRPHLLRLSCICRAFKQIFQNQRRRPQSSLR